MQSWILYDGEEYASLEAGRRKVPADGLQPSCPTIVARR
jgi:hypothetical protein